MSNLIDIPSYFELDPNYLDPNYRTAVFTMLTWDDEYLVQEPYYENSLFLSHLQEGNYAGSIMVLVYENRSDAWKSWDFLADVILTDSIPMFYMREDESALGWNLLCEDCETAIAQTATISWHDPSIVWLISVISPEGWESALDKMTDIFLSTDYSVIEVIE